MHPKPILWLTALIPLAGFTDCSEFSTVTVPPTGQDRTVPIVGTRMWIDGEERIDLGSASHVSLTGDVVLVPFILDRGGAGSLSTTETVVVTCHDSDAEPELTQVSTLTFFPQTTSQRGAPGQQRSDGLYLIGRVSVLTDFTSLCNAGFAPRSVAVRWESAGRDLSGNRASTIGLITWQPARTYVSPWTEAERDQLEVELMSDPAAARRVHDHHPGPHHRPAVALTPARVVEPRPRSSETRRSPSGPPHVRGAGRSGVHRRDGGVCTASTQPRSERSRVSSSVGST
jgi:hypothetical protein